MKVLSGRSGEPPNPIQCYGVRGSIASHLPMSIKTLSGFQTFGLQTDLPLLRPFNLYVKNMTRKSATPDEIANAVAMREAGYTVLSISQKVNISIRSLQRHFTEHGAKRGALKKELFDSARLELLKRVISDDTIREETARLINDDLAHARHLRSLMVNASELLQATTLQEAVLVMRAAAAYSTAIRNTSDTIRHTLRIDRTIEETATELPELFIHELSPEEITTLRVGQLEEEVQTG